MNSVTHTRTTGTMREQTDSGREGATDVGNQGGRTHRHHRRTGYATTSQADRLPEHAEDEQPSSPRSRVLGAPPVDSGSLRCPDIGTHSHTHEARN